MKDRSKVINMIRYYHRVERECVNAAKDSKDFLKESIYKLEAKNAYNHQLALKKYL